MTEPRIPTTIQDLTARPTIEPASSAVSIAGRFDDIEACKAMIRQVEKLMLCLHERYKAEGNEVKRMGNEILSFHCRLEPEQAKKLAIDLEEVVGPHRRANAHKMVGEIEATLDQIRQLQIDPLKKAALAMPKVLR